MGRLTMCVTEREPVNMYDFNVCFSLFFFLARVYRFYSLSLQTDTFFSFLIYRYTRKDDYPFYCRMFMCLSAQFYSPLLDSA